MGKPILSLPFCASVLRLTLATPAPAAPPSTPTLPHGSPEKHLLDDFYSDLGVSFTKVAHNTWKEGPGHGGFGEDSTTFFSNWNNPTCKGAQQAVSVTNSKKKMWPFHGSCMNYSTWGLLFSLREEDEFWKYFQIDKEKCNGAPFGTSNLSAPLMAQCGDCSGRCCGSLCDPLYPTELVGNKMSYKDWVEKTASIVQQTGNNSICPNLGACAGDETPLSHAWNEFSVNGLSYDALVGILVDRTEVIGQIPPAGGPPNRQDVCNFMAIVNKYRKHPRAHGFPIFDFNVTNGTSSLIKTGYLHCDSAEHVGAGNIQPVLV